MEALTADALAGCGAAGLAVGEWIFGGATASERSGRDVS
jgi:hypothetical protein